MVKRSVETAAIKKTVIGQGTLGVGALISQALVIALRDWRREAELTAGCAGLLCAQDIDPCIRAFMKLVYGRRSLMSGAAAATARWPAPWSVGILEGALRRCRKRFGELPE